MDVTLGGLGDAANFSHILDHHRARGLEHFRGFLNTESQLVDWEEGERPVANFFSWTNERKDRLASPLHWAISSKHLDLVKLVMTVAKERGYNLLKARDDDQEERTPLMQAAGNDQR